MINLTTPNEWQRHDQYGVIMPYYTHPALAWLDDQDLKGKRIFEYGVGLSTLWYRSRGAVVYGAETSKEWAALVGGDCNVYEEKEIYVSSIKQVQGLFDIVVVDGDPVEWRDDCVTAALTRLKGDGYLIFDNYCQPSLGWMPSKETQNKLTMGRPYGQHNHPDWQTLIFKNRTSTAWNQ